MKVAAIFLFALSLFLGAEGQRTYENPILDHAAADPCIIKHNGGYFMVYTQGDRIDLLSSPILSNWRQAERREIYHVPQGGSALWAPELHLIRGELYCYFTMQVGPNDADHRMFVIKANNVNDPMGGGWSPEATRLLAEDIYAIDGTVMQYGNGELYFIWTGHPQPANSMNLYIARMDNPMSVTSPRVLLRTPTMDWERHGFPVNEGPFIIQNEGRTFLVFSASSTFTPDYCLGIMGIDDLKDPLVPGNWWNDVNHPIFSTNEPEGVWAPGHASFVRSPDDSELWMVYHAVDNRDDNGRNRRARIQKLEWNPDRAPRFPWPIGIGKPLPAPSGER